MKEAPRRPGLRPGRAAGIESGLDLRFNTRSQLKSQYPDYLRRQRHAQAAHALGARVFHEFVEELRRHHPNIAADIDKRIEAYAEINPVALAVAGGDKFAPVPLHVVGRSQ